MALEIPVGEFFSLLGHDGSQIVEPGLEDPLGRAGVHWQEAIDVCWCLGYAVTSIEFLPQAVNYDGQTPRVITFPGGEGNWGRFIRHINHGRGVILCAGRRCAHAVAFENGHVFDPAGYEYPFSREAMEHRGLFTTCLWRVDRRK